MRQVLLCGQCTRWETAGGPERYTNAGHRKPAYMLVLVGVTSVKGVLDKIGWGGASSQGRR